MPPEPLRPAIADYEIDLAELVHALSRQRRWWLIAVALGLLLWGAFGMAQPRTRELALLIALDQGPQRSQTQDPSLNQHSSKRVANVGLVMQPPIPMLPMSWVQRQLEQKVAMKRATTPSNWCCQVV